MESITEHLIINCVSHFTFGVRFGFKTIELAELDETMNACKDYFNEKLEKFKSIEDVAGIRLQFPEDFSTSVHGMVIPRAHQLMSDVVEENNSVWEWTWAILTFGLKDFFIRNESRAKAIVNNFIG